MSHRTLLIAVMVGASVAVASTGVAVAISGGGYTPAKQGCNKRADSNNREDRKQPRGCHDSQILVRDGSGHTYAEAGTRTTKEGSNVHAANVMVSPTGTGNAKGGAKGSAARLHADTHYQPIPKKQCGVFDLLTYGFNVVTKSGCTADPTKWRLPKRAPSVTPKVSTGKRLAVAPDATSITVYFGADDGVDSGEHDEPDGKHGTKKAQNGASDGGAITLRWHPVAVASWLPLIMAGAERGNLSHLAENPLPFLSGGAGGCADGICISTQTRRTQAYRGGGRGGKRRDAYNYDGKKWDPYDCSGASPAAEKKCHDKTHKNEDAYYRREARHVYLEPGVQLYEDPDPNGSPVAPMYPLPAAYVGTCGVTVGGGALKVPASPITNHSGQLSVSPSRC